MPVLCKFKPQRSSPRVFTAKSAVRVCCNAISHGASKREILAGVQKCGGNAGDDRFSEASAAAVAVEALSQDNVLYTGLEDALTKVLAVLGILAVIGRFIKVLPAAPARIVAVAAPAAREAVKTYLQRVQTRRAANDEVIEFIRQQAANDQFYKLQGSRF